MRELETKLKVERMSAIEVSAVLSSELALSFGQPNEQCDWVFATDRAAIATPREGTVVSRVREDASGRSLTVKVRRGSDLDRVEHELGIDNVDIGREILLALGLAHVVTVRKSRFEARASPSVSVLVDDVEALGVFVEIEVLGSDDDDAAQTLNEVAERVSLALDGRVHKVEVGYDRLLLQQHDASVTDR